MNTIKCIVKLKCDEGKLMPARRGVVEKVDILGIECYVKQYIGAWEEKWYRISDLIKTHEIMV